MTEKSEKFDADHLDAEPLDGGPDGLGGRGIDLGSVFFDPLSDAEVDAADLPGMQSAYKLLRARYDSLRDCHDDFVSGRQERRERDQMLTMSVQNVVAGVLNFMEKREDRYAQDIVAKRAHELQMLQMQNDLIVKLATRQV